jgi:hypothetical protein
MAEIQRAPVKIAVGDTEYAAFDAGHTLSDIARWAMTNPVEGEELHRILGELVA